MNIYQKTYNKIQKEDELEDTRIAKKVLQEFAEQTGYNIKAYENVSSDLNQILCLLSTGHEETLIPILEKYHYNYRAELQYIIANICAKDNEFMLFGKGSIDSYQKVNTGYLLNTIYGQVGANKVTKCFANVQAFVKPGYCHETCEVFVRSYQNLSVSTILLDRAFYGKHYHSIVHYNDAIIDLALGLYTKDWEYDLLFKPIILNTVSGTELEEERKRISSKETLAENNSLLLKLALEKQVEKGISIN